MALRNNNIKININARPQKKEKNSFIINIFKRISIFKISIFTWIFGKVIK